MPQNASSSSAADDELPLAINSLSYSYPGALPVISEFTLNLPRGSRCLLLGANGAGETSLHASGAIACPPRYAYVSRLRFDLQERAHFFKSSLAST